MNIGFDNEKYLTDAVRTYPGTYQPSSATSFTWNLAANLFDDLSRIPCTSGISARTASCVC